ncbi:cupredoxin domain-containing protein [Paraherbaspirillum soli]|uniref:Cupredoxin family copper-binding protein n=1 Tax=Paraherbaspirillum soli TaxID=631222 RepID=A0ABW0MBR1_9BURK
MNPSAYSSRGGWRHQRLALTKMLLIAVAATAYAAAIGAAQANTHTVVIEGLKYSPEVIEVNAGDTVVWTNKDPYPHTVTADNRSFDSKQIAPDHSWKFTAKAKGEFSYTCTVHPTMKGKLVVK